jgi:hypothetical protein
MKHMDAALLKRIKIRKVEEKLGNPAPRNKIYFGYKKRALIVRSTVLYIRINYRETDHRMQ